MLSTSTLVQMYDLSAPKMRNTTPASARPTPGVKNPQRLDGVARIFGRFCTLGRQPVRRAVRFRPFLHVSPSAPSRKHSPPRESERGGPGWGQGNQRCAQASAALSGSGFAGSGKGPANPVRFPKSRGLLFNNGFGSLWGIRYNYTVNCFML